MDFFRGILNRLPDSGSLQYWVGQLRAAQCQGADAVTTAAYRISAAFVNNPEYNARQRNPTQFVTDMYYAYLRRGGDLAGVKYWISTINDGRLNYDGVREQFFNSPEFYGRLQAVINAGCYTGP